jgi:hypothetical protein
LLSIQAPGSKTHSRHACNNRRCHQYSGHLPLGTLKFAARRRWNRLLVMLAERYGWLRVQRAECWPTGVLLHELGRLMHVSALKSLIARGTSRFAPEGLFTTLPSASSADEFEELSNLQLQLRPMARTDPLYAGKLQNEGGTSGRSQSVTVYAYIRNLKGTLVQPLNGACGALRILLRHKALLNWHAVHWHAAQVRLHVAPVAQAQSNQCNADGCSSLTSRHVTARK